MDNPTQVRFVPSVDHGTLTRYELRSVEVETSSASGATSIGLPTPSGGYCTVDLDTGGWTEDLAYRVEVRSVRGTDESAWAPSSNTGVITEPPEETLYGPQASIEPPEGAVMLAAGQGSAALQTLINANPGATTFGIAAGVHTWTSVVTPKTGNTFIGGYGAILDGTGWAFTDLTQAAFRAHNQNIDDVTIKNLVIRNMPFEGIRALAPQAAGWLIESCEIHANRFGLQIGSTMTVKKNYIHHNIGANPSSAVYTDRGGAYRGYLAVGPILIEDNHIAYNGPEQKLTGTTGVITRGNWWHHNHTDGIWYDADNLDALIEDNVVEDHPRAGIFYEISGNGIIRNNTIRRNGLTGSSYGISISSSKDVEVYGNTLEGNYRGIRFLVDCTRVGGGVIPGGWDLRDNSVHDNTISTPAGSTQPAAMLQVISCSVEQTLAYTDGTKNLHYEDNTYYVSNLAGNLWYWNVYKNWTQWTAIGHDNTGAHLPL